MWTVWKFRDLKGSEVISVRRSEPNEQAYAHYYQEILGVSECLTKEAALNDVKTRERQSYGS